MKIVPEELRGTERQIDLRSHRRLLKNDNVKIILLHILRCK